MNPEAYNAYITQMRQTEYPSLTQQTCPPPTYLDHASTTPPASTLLHRFTSALTRDLYSNPHSHASPSGRLSSSLVAETRGRLLRFLRASGEEFEVVFVGNATGGVKVVLEGLRGGGGKGQEGFWYGYHGDGHTSLVGGREEAGRSRCFVDDGEVEAWMDQEREVDGLGDERLGLFAWPAQSNMHGRRLPLDWSRRVRERKRGVFSLLDAAALVSTSPLDLSDAASAPDFTVLSLYKIFGFPDLGALIVRKGPAVEQLFRRRRYFGGGTVDMVVCSGGEEWFARKSGSLAESLEDGTLPVQSLVALREALQTHEELFGGMEKVARHTASLTRRLFDGLRALKHGTGREVCRLYSARLEDESARKQGPIVALNFVDGRGNWVSNTEVEKLAAVKNIHLRTGGLCNPGGIATALGLSPWEMRDNFSAGHRCGGENDILNGKPTGMIRLSLGAMSTVSDVEAFLDFAREFFVDETTAASAPPSPLLVDGSHNSRLHIESLTVYPIKSCAGWQIPLGQAWEVRSEGLAWDREWCIVHQGTGAALSQKRYPRMALIRPSLDFKNGVLRISASGRTEELTVPLSLNPSYLATSPFRQNSSTVCDDPITTHLYTSSEIADYLTTFLNVPCTLARFPPTTHSTPSTRHSKTHLQPSNRPRNYRPTPSRPILLSNESPILTISRSSLNRLNETIKATNGKAAPPEVFRANIVLAESPLLPPGGESPWAEDGWSGMRVLHHRPDDGNSKDAEPVAFEFLGGCRRCQMVCVDQRTGERDQEPFVTLAKTRRFEGRVLFGVHTALERRVGRGGGWVRVGDGVEVFCGSGEQGV